MRIITIILSLLAFTEAARADPPRANHYHWRNTNYPSHYVLYDYASRTWIETVDCRVFNRFTLVRNEVNTLTLYDASRDMTMLLNYEGMFLKAHGASGFSFYQNGTFDTRTLFQHADAAISKHHACVWEEWFSGASRPTFSFVQSAVSPDAVELYDRSRDIGVRLESSRMLLRQGNVPFSYFKAGRWN